MENKVAELELQKTTAEQKAKQYETQVAALEEQKDSLEVLLNVENEQRTDIEPLTKHALMLKSKIYQMQLQIADEGWTYLTDDMHRSDGRPRRT